MIEIVAHRGSREGTHEHTLSAFRKAILDGADSMECDVRLTADGELVCLHDRRVDFVSNGRGIVSTMELAALQDIHFGVRRQWRPLDKFRGDVDRPGPGEDPADTGVVTLRQLLELVADAPRPIGLCIETKHPNRHGGAVEQKLVELLDEFDLIPAERAASQIGQRPAVRVMSFAAPALRRMQVLAPTLDLVHLMGRVPRSAREGRLPEGVFAAGRHVGIVRRTPEFVEALHAAGNACYVWTVNKEEDASTCLNAGVDALITDRPVAIGNHARGRWAESA